MTVQKQTFGAINLVRPKGKDIPYKYRDRVNDLFDTWVSVSARNRGLSRYYDMKNEVKNLGISVPTSLDKINCVVGWCKKAVDAMCDRSVFDGFVFEGVEDPDLSALVRANRLRTKSSMAVRSSLIHGVSAMTVMKGEGFQPDVMVRAFSANQFAALWDKDAERIACGIALVDVDRKGAASKYVVHFPESVLTMTRDGKAWAFDEEPNIMGRPMMEVFVNDPDIDRPLGHSLLTPEILGIVDKAMRDVLRMEVGAEFFTFPQRYILGASEDMFSIPSEGCEQNADGEWVDGSGNVVEPVSDENAKFRAYIGALMAISRDETGDVPQVGQFSPGSADNFTRVFENDAQRFSGATNVPLAQLGVLSNTYTSSDALGAANDPLILAVEVMNRRNGEVMEEIARMMMAVAGETSLDNLKPEQKSVQAHWKDPGMPTISARADAWTKFGASDKSIVGTRVYYEGMGMSQATIDRLNAEKKRVEATEMLNRIAEAMPTRNQGE